jgi:hypothetical protein
LSLNNTAKAFFIAGAITENLFDRILSFNRIRNAVVHKLFFEPSKKEYRGVPRQEYDAAYNCGLEVCDLLETIEDELVG